MTEKWLLVLLIVGGTSLVFVICFPIDFCLYRRRKRQSREKKMDMFYSKQPAKVAPQRANVITEGVWLDMESGRGEESKSRALSGFQRLLNLVRMKQREQHVHEREVKDQNTTSLNVNIERTSSTNSLLRESSPEPVFSPSGVVLSGTNSTDSDKTFIKSETGKRYPSDNPPIFPKLLPPDNNDNTAVQNKNSTTKVQPLLDPIQVQCQQHDQDDENSKKRPDNIQNNGIETPECYTVPIGRRKNSLPPIFSSNALQSCLTPTVEGRKLKSQANAKMRSMSALNQIKMNRITKRFQVRSLTTSDSTTSIEESSLSDDAFEPHQPHVGQFSKQNLELDMTSKAMKRSLKGSLKRNHISPMTTEPQSRPISVATAEEVTSSRKLRKESKVDSRSIVKQQSSVSLPDITSKADKF